MSSWSRCGKQIIVALSLALALLAAPAGAQQRPVNRVLGGHNFIPSSFMGDPFVATSIRTVTGAATVVDLQVPILDLDGNVITTVSGNVGFMLLGINYQQQIAPWLGLWVDANVGGRVGTSTISLIAEGATAQYSGGVGGVLRLVRSDRLQAAAVVGWRRSALYTITPLQWARNLIEEGQLDTTNTLLNSGKNWRLLTGLRGAYAISRPLGVTAVVEVVPGGGSLSSDDSTDTQFNLGGTVSLDLRPAQHVPVGLVGSLLYRSSTDATGDIATSSWLYGLGVFYTGRQEFALGLDLAYEQVGQAYVDNKMNAVQARLVLRYDFR